MANVKDIKQTDGDLDIVNGDFAIVDSDTQHVEDILVSIPGHWREFPAVGVNLKKYTGASGGVQRVKREIRVQMKLDQFDTKKISIEGDNIYITADRKNAKL